MSITRATSIGAAVASAVVLACLTGTAPAHASTDRRVEENISELVKAKSPGATWAAMSSTEQREITSEFNDATVEVREVDQPESSLPVTPSARFSGCWTRATEAIFIGGVTKRKMFAVGQRTQACVKSKKVKSVKVISPYSRDYGVAGISVAKPTTGKFNAGYEGRGVARAESTLGLNIPKVGPIGAKRTICAKIYLNANGKSVRFTQECHV